MAAEVDAYFHITELYAELGWDLILRLLNHIYPNLVWEFYANIGNKRLHSGKSSRIHGKEASTCGHS